MTISSHICVLNLLHTFKFRQYQESKADYLELRRQSQNFAVDLLDQSRNSQELAIILNHDPDEPPFSVGEHMKLARLELAINFKQKKVGSYLEGI